jgi:predicted DsbA family dithiol-disulfide isomerase
MSTFDALMNDPSLRFFFDAVDPLSFAMHRALGAAEEQTDIRVAREPIESYPAHAPLTDTHDPFWRARWSEGQRVAETMGFSLVRPDLIPRSRKAHELLLHAKGSELGRPVLDAIFEAYFLEGRDIGRIDVLVDIATSLGLDLTETKAVLDVDRYEADILRVHQQAIEAGVTSTPTLVAGTRTLKGFHNQAAIGTLLDGR